MVLEFQGQSYVKDTYRKMFRLLSHGMDSIGLISDLKQYLFGL